MPKPRLFDSEVFLSHYYARNVLIYKFFEMPSFFIINLVISLFSFFLLRFYIGDHLSSKVYFV